MHKNPQRAFTLIELLLVIGIIAILALALVIAINPGEKLAQARDVTRERHIYAIEQAILAYRISKGHFPNNINNIGGEICNNFALELEENCSEELIDISDLVPDYLPYLPIDPLKSEDSSGIGYGVLVEEKTFIVWAMEGETKRIGTRPALKFDGEGSHVVAPQENKLLEFNGEEVTMAAWIKIPDTSGEKAIIFTGGGWNRKGVFFTINSGRVRFQIGDGSSEQFTSQGNVPENEWVLVGGMWSEKNDTIYHFVNENIYVAGSWEEGYFSNSSFDVNFGRVLNNGGNPERFMDGKISEIYIYNRALSSEEIKKLYEEEYSREGLVGHWIFDEARGCVVSDLSENDNHGSLETNCPEESPFWTIGR